MNNNEGPRVVKIPSQQETVCNGCAYLKLEGMMYGRFKVTKNYYCMHPEIEKDFKDKCIIHFNHEGYCDTPTWCPFLK